MPHHVSGINFLVLSVNLIYKILYIRFALFCSYTTTSSLVDSPVSASVTPPLFYFRLKTYTFFANLFIHHDSLPACRTYFTNFMTPDRLFWTTRFLQRAQCSHCKRCTSYSNSVCLSVRLSVCLSVTRRYCVKTAARSTVQFVPLDSKMCLVL